MYRFLITALIFASCTTTPKLFSKMTPHESYGKKLSNAGLEQTSLGRQWFLAADQALYRPTAIKLPFSETGYFAVDKPSSAGFTFSAKRGEKITITVLKRPENGFLLYMDFWEKVEGKQKLILSADTLLNPVNYEIKRTGEYIIRLQPELLKSGDYTLTIIAQPTLVFPVTPNVKARITGFWGDGRDQGSRKHEGVDIFATPPKSALVAAAPGIITRVESTDIGGKVVWLRPDNSDYSLYYAHLDTQFVEPGQRVETGATIGIIGNTGNAKGGTPHLHFGIYTSDGAVDPFVYINPQNKTAEKITGSTDKLGKYLRGIKAGKVYSQTMTTSTSINAADIPLKAISATAEWYKVQTPAGEYGFIKTVAVQEIEKVIKPLTVSKKYLYESPDSLSPRKLYLEKPEKLDVIGEYSNYYYVKNNIGTTGWIVK